MDVSGLERLADLIAQRNAVSAAITAMTGRPAQIGHLGEFIASKIFDIRPESSATNKGFDGRFASGTLSGKTVDVKWYGKKEGILDLRTSDLPDYYLVLTGPSSFAMSSRGEERPWLIEHVHLFEAEPLVRAVAARGVKIGVATSVAREFWEAAEVYPDAANGVLRLSAEQRQALGLFSGKRRSG
jgi:hypothetical protein